MPAPRSKQREPLLATLNAAAATREVNNLVSLDKYYRSAVLMQRQADEYRRAHNTEQLYVILMRLVSLVVETIPKHQTFAPDNQYMQLRITCAENALPELEKLRLELHLKDTARLEKEPYKPRKVPGTIQIRAGPVDGLHWDNGASLDQNAVDVSILESLGTPEWTAATASASPSLATTTSPPPPQQLPNLPDLTMSVQLPAAVSQATLAKHSLLPASLQAQISSSSGSKYPSAPHISQIQQQAAQRPSYPQVNQQPPPMVSPYNGELQLGPQELPVQTAPYPTLPLPPGETCCPPLQGPGSQIVPTPPPGVAEVKKRQQIRDVHVSVALMDEFLRFAMSNTRRGIETCGILAGSLSADDASFTVSALLVPKQEGTSDTVQALAEEEIFEVQDSRGLYPLGWIHTHPTQTCFMSSVDIHTHCGYQTMLDEAIAIVMAPRDAKTPVGMFRLSTPGGLKLVQQCHLRGFHAHPPTETGQSIYELCGHVYLNPRVKFEVIDLRDR